MFTSMQNGIKFKISSVRFCVHFIPWKKYASISALSATGKIVEQSGFQT